MITYLVMNFGSTADSIENRIITHDRVNTALDEFRNKNSKLRLVLLFLVCFILLFVMVDLQNVEPIYYPNEVMYITGMLAAASSLLVFYFLMELIPETFSILWKRKIIAIRKDADITTLEKQYSEYIRDLGRLMSNPIGQLLVGFLFVSLVFSWAYSWIEYLIEPLIAFFIGIMAWRVIVISIRIRKLCKEFYLRPQLLHADKCGGLKPLGNLCLCNALIVLIPGVYLGSWVLVGLIFKEDTNYSLLAKDFTPLFLRLLLIPIVFAFIDFALPLWNVRQIMVTWRAEIREQLDRLGYYIDYLDFQLLRQTYKLEPMKCGEMYNELKQMREIYQINNQIPVWPSNFMYIVEITALHVVPFLGFILQLIGLLMKSG